MSMRMKRVLFALAVGIIFVLLTRITDAQTPQANLRGQIKQSRSTATANTTRANGAAIRTQRQLNSRQQTQRLFLQQQFLIHQQSIQPQFIVVPGAQRGVGMPNVTANQFVPLSGSGQNFHPGSGFGFGLGVPQQRQQIQRVNRISTSR